MDPRHARLLVWGFAALFIGGSSLAMGKPMLRAYHCVARYSDAPEATATLIEIQENAALVERTSGTRQGERCLVPGSFEAEPAGMALDVVYLEHAPERCELRSTVENSRIVLGAVAFGLLSVFLLVIGLAVVVLRTLTRPAEPTRRMDRADAPPCPVCDAKMGEGYVALQSGLHWRELGQPVGLTPLYRGLPGTVGMRGRPRLHAYRCERCEVVTLQYGQPDR